MNGSETTLLGDPLNGTDGYGPPMLRAVIFTICSFKPEANKLYTSASNHEKYPTKMLE